MQVYDQHKLLSLRYKIAHLISTEHRHILLVGLGLALVRSGWIMLTVGALNHTLSPAQTLGLGHITVPILRMWQFIVIQVSLLDQLTSFM